MEKPETTLPQTSPALPEDNQPCQQIGFSINSQFDPTSLNYNPDQSGPTKDDEFYSTSSKDLNETTETGISPETEINPETTNLTTDDKPNAHGNNSDGSSMGNSDGDSSEDDENRKPTMDYPENEPDSEEEKLRTKEDAERLKGDATVIFLSKEYTEATRKFHEA